MGAVKALRLMAAAAASAALVTGMATSANAATRDSTNVGAMTRIAEGTYTSADLALIKSQPKLAAVTPDPANVVVTSEAATPSGGLLSTESTTSTTCGWNVGVHVKQYSLTGSLIYDWVHYVQWCGNGSAVTSWQSRYDYLAKASGIVVWGGLTADQQAGIGTFQAWSYRQRHLTYCVVKYGCYANVYPWSKIVVDARGYYSYTRGS